MKNSKLINYLLILSLVICFITTSTKGVLAAKSTELNEIIFEYINYIHNFSTGFYSVTPENIAASLLNYDSKLDPALVLIYTAEEYSQYGTESNLYLEILTYKDGKIEKKCSKVYDHDGALAEDEYEWNIIKDTKTGLDYIEVTGGRYAQGYEYEFKYYYKFDGDKLVNLATINGMRNVDIEPNSKMTYQYFLNEEKVSKSNFDKVMNTKKKVANLLERDWGNVRHTNGLKLLNQAIQPTLYLNNNKINTNPVMVNGRTLVPVRALLEEMGATIKWDGKTRIVTAIKGNTTVIMKIDSKIVTVNGEAFELDVPAKLINSSTYIPARFISESFGYDVYWDKIAKRIDIKGPRY
ncbi:copper amine oxidase N-terminal domain-containing protein [Clostridium sp. Cult2]|uniref:copper amine oxidase N-terminal domain-containing protein n=1 Tax=Clostridium sp. Cult2 TaxID=2079003 RepID=UPI001F197F9E|nr:copper amine oxidase N-terminal domain-containing protein [Clostridium sp. Cult2]